MRFLGFIESCYEAIPLRFEIDEMDAFPLSASAFLSGLGLLFVDCFNCNEW